MIPILKMHHLSLHPQYNTDRFPYRQFEYTQLEQFERAMKEAVAVKVALSWFTDKTLETLEKL
jgi:hypothetical protein